MPKGESIKEKITSKLNFNETIGGGDKLAQGGKDRIRQGRDKRMTMGKIQNRKD